MNRLLFVYGELRHGGIETLIVRLANHLAGHGRKIAVLVPGGELAKQLSQGVNLIAWDEPPDAIAKGAAWVAASGEPVTLVSFDPISAALGLAIESRIGSPNALIHISGIYHPRAYFMTGERRDRKLLNRLVAKAVGDPLIFFMNAEGRAGHERQWRVSLTSSAIIPLAIEERRATWKPTPGERLRVASVGRLVDFKAYNLSAAEIARECAEAGVPVSWDIYGTGPLAEAIQESIERHGAGAAVALKGTLPYASFAKVIAGYDLFVGMGTAVLEAAMLGVPTIVTTESEPRRSYGFLHQLPFGNVGERQAAPPPFDLAELIGSFAKMGLDERRGLSRRCREAVRPYGMDNYVAVLDRLAAEPFVPPSLWFKRAVSAVYKGLTTSRLAEFTRRLKANGSRL